MSNYYQIGALVPVPKTRMYQRGVAVGGWVATPEVIRDEINQLHAEMMATGQEIRDSLFQSGSWLLKPDVLETDAKYMWYKGQWAPFMAQWLKFRDDHTGWWANLWGSTWDQVQDYRKKLAAFRDSARNVGQKFYGPEPIAPKEGPLAVMATETWRIVKIVLYAALGIAIVYVLGKMFGWFPVAKAV